MNKFDNLSTTLEALTKNKKPDCITALTREFNFFRGEGYDLRQSYHLAELSHFMKDHEGHNYLPKLTIQNDDETVRAAALEAIMDRNDDGKAEDRADVYFKWYDLFRKLEFPVSLSFKAAHEAARDEWDDTNDMDEAKAVQDINQITLGLDDELKDATFKTFYSLRNEGNNVRSSIRQALEQLQQAMLYQSLLSGISGRLGGGRIQ